MTDFTHRLLSSVPEVKPRPRHHDPDGGLDLAEVMRGGQFNVGFDGDYVSREGSPRHVVTIDAITNGGDKWVVKLSTGHKVIANWRYLMSPTSMARDVEDLTGKPLIVPRDIECLDDWEPYVLKLIHTPELAHA